LPDFDLETLLGQFENPELEFKEALPSNRAIAELACALANGRGGRFIVSVRDEDRAIVGIDPASVFDLEAKVTNIIHDTVEPPVTPQFSTFTHEGKTIFIANVFRGSLKPYFIKADGKDSGTYVRVGSQTRRAEAATIRALELERANTSYDQVPVFDAKPTELAATHLRHYLTKRQEVRGIPAAAPTEDFLLSIGALKREQGQVVPTVGGLLLFSDAPQQHVPYARVRCARFKGTKMGDSIDQKEYDGPLYKQVEGAMQFFRAHVPRSAKVEGLYRKEQDEYPEEAIREAVANAVCHRDYLTPQSDIKCAMFDDRIEITSPGALPGSISVPLLGTGISEPRNRVIARVFREMGIIEEWGQGTAKMRDAMVAIGLPAPVYRENGPYFKVILPGPKAAEVAARDELDMDEQKILSIAQAEGRITTREAMEATGRSRPTVLRKLTRLQAIGLLTFRGVSQKDPTGHYVPTRGDQP
jgi:ATP-dependent DNA helicase RecG